MNDHDKNGELTDDGDAADVGAALAAVSLEPQQSEPETPREAGPRRRVLIVLAATIGALLVWMLFRSVPSPSESPGEDDRAERRAESVEGMASEADPSWMQNSDSAALAATRSDIVPPVFAPAGSGAREYQQVDSAAVPGQPIESVAPGGAAETPTVDPRREAFLAALRSRPLQNAAAAGASAQVSSGGADREALPEPPSVADMDAAAQAEAERRSVPATGGERQGFAVAATPSAASVSPAQGTGSSYLTGGSGSRPEAAAPQRLQPMSTRTSQERLTIPVGTVIEGQLHTSVSSDLPGNVVGMVTRDVYDSDQRAVVIPRYSWLFGTYESDVATGQARLVVQWTAIRFPSGHTYELPALRAGDRGGASGLRGNVNNHYGRLFSQALLSSVVAAGLNAAGNSTSERVSTRDALAQATAQRLGETAAEVTRRNLTIKPTITVPRLTRFSILLDRDLTFTPPARR